MKIPCTKISLFSVIAALLTSGMTYAKDSDVTLSLSIGKPPAEEGKTSVAFNIPGQQTFKKDVTESEKNVGTYNQFPWKSLEGITLHATATGVDITDGECSDSVPSFINKQGKIIDSVNLALNFKFIKKDQEQIVCKMKGTYKNDGTVKLLAKLSEGTSARDVSFTINDIAKKYSLTSNSTSLEAGYPMPSLLQAVPISTKKTIGTATGKCPAVTEFTNGTQILKEVTYEISYSLKNGLNCTATPTWQDIP